MRPVSIFKLPWSMMLQGMDIGKGEAISSQFYGTSSWSSILSVITAPNTPSNKSVWKSMTMLSLFCMRSSLSSKSSMNSLFPTTLYSRHYESFLARDIAKSVWSSHIVTVESGIMPYALRFIPSDSNLSKAIMFTGSSHSYTYPSPYACIARLLESKIGLNTSG